MKKPFLLILLLVLSIASFAIAECEPLESGDFTFRLEADSTVAIVGYTGVGGAVTIPDEIGGHEVVALNDSAFYSQSAITSITLPATLTRVGAYALSGTSIQALTIPASVSMIGDHALAGVTQLQSVTIEGEISDIGVNPFLECTALSEIIVSEDQQNLSVVNGCLIFEPEKRMVSYASGQVSSTLLVPPGIQTIGSEALALSNVDSIFMSYGVEKIDIGAFAGSHAKSIMIPNSVVSINKHPETFATDGDLTLIVCEGSYAEQFALSADFTYQSIPPFSFRAGIGWDSSSETVMEAEAEFNPLSPFNDGAEVLAFGVEIDHKSGCVKYMFYGEQLYYITFNFDTKAAAAFTDVQAFLSQVHGAPAIDGSSELLYGKLRPLDLLAIENALLPPVKHAVVWVLPDETMIFLIRYSYGMMTLHFANMSIDGI